MFAQRAAGILVQIFHFLRNASTGQNAQPLNHAEGKATGKPGQCLIFLQVDQRLKQRLNLARDEMLQTAFDLLGHIWPRSLIDKNLDLRRKRIRTGNKFADRMLTPHQAALIGVINFSIGCVVEPVRAQMILRSERLQGRRFQRLGFCALRGFVRREPEAFKLTDEFAFDGDFTLVIYFGQKGLLLFEPPQQN